jgi:hypothetical protein
MSKPDLAYALRFTVSATIGIILATVPPLILDPQLTSHVRYGARTYSDTTWVLPVCAATFFITLAMTVLPRTSRRLAYPLLPLAAALLCSLPFLRPEVPHGNVVMVGTVWLLVLFVWHWIHVGLEVPGDSHGLSVDYLKEEILFCRSLLLGFVAAYLSLFITALTALHTSNTSIVKKASEVFLLQKYSDLQVSLISILFFLGPVYEGLRKLRQFMRLLRSIPASTTA